MKFTERDWYFIKRIQRLESTVGMLISCLHLRVTGAHETEELFGKLLKKIPNRCKPKSSAKVRIKR